MTDANWARLADLVPDALALPPDHRRAFLVRACTDGAGRADDALVEEALALVGAADAADASGALRGTAGWRPAPPPTETVPETIGPWRLLERLGDGGMGVVYRAERADGLYRREVALKRLHPTLAQHLRSRLDAERHALARLEHHGVARLYDGGLDDQGAPFLVMELVDGVPITDYADAEGLDVRGRVALFAQVCAAVAYAHGRLVVHRDLKPSNVFVTRPAADRAGAPTGGAVKLLDFGIAKLLGGDEAAHTQTHAAMTPAYAAPEQLTRGEITTATDVYALGVMLYELLAGQRPYSLSGVTAAEAERIVTTVQPAPASAAAPADRARALRGDLDTIVAKALAKEPARRYASAEALAADLRRHLDGLPVEARPASVRYRVGKFAQRHRVGAAATAIVAAALVAGTALALWQARVARAEAATSAATSAFLVGLFDAANAEEDGRDVRVAHLLDRAAADLDGAFAGTPTTEAALRHTLGSTYRSLGLYDEAEAQLARALALRTRLVGARHPDVAEVQESLGRLYVDRGDYARADSVLRLALATARRHPGPGQALLSDVLTDLGQARYETGDAEGTVPFYRESLAIEEATRAPSDPERLVSMENLALALYDSGDTDGGTRMLERMVVLLRRHRPRDDKRLGNSLANLGSFYVEQGRAPEAAALQREAVARFRRHHGDRHPDLAFALNNLGSTLGTLDRHAEAEPLLRESVAIYSTAFGAAYADHPDVGFPLVNLAKTLQALGRLPDAERAARRAVAVFTDAFGADHPLTARAQVVLAGARLDAGRTAEAVALYRTVVATREAALPPGHADLATARSLLGDALGRGGPSPEAERLLASSAAALRDSLGADAPTARAAAERLAAYRAR